MNNELYFRPSKLITLNNKNFDFEFLDEYSNENYNNIVLPSWLFTSPEDTIINYFSVLREAENVSQGGCGSIGLAKSPYPIAYNFFTSEYKSRINYSYYFNSFKNIGHINLIKLKKIYNYDVEYTLFDRHIEKHV